MIRGSNNIAVGDSAGKDAVGSNNIYFANDGLASDSGAIRIGTAGIHRSAQIAGITGVTVAGGVAVVVDSSGTLGISTSSARYKDAIQPIGTASDVILSLQPVSFRYKQEIDPNRIPQFRLVAEQVEKVDPALVAHDNRGKPYAIRYEAVNAMLLNEFLKEHRKVEDQASRIEQLERELQQVTARLNAQGL